MSFATTRTRSDEIHFQNCLLSLHPPKGRPKIPESVHIDKFDIYSKRSRFFFVPLFLRSEISMESNIQSDCYKSPFYFSSLHLKQFSKRAEMRYDIRKTKILWIFKRTQLKSPTNSHDMAHTFIIKTTSAC